MPSEALRRLHYPLAIVTGLFGLATVAVAAAVLQRAPVEGLVIRNRVEENRWAVFEFQEVASGVTIPADTNVVFHLPPQGFTRISRDVLLGLKSHDVRYWGYCFPQNYEESVVLTRRGLRGLVFLSDKERKIQEGLLAEQIPRYTLSRLPTKDEVSHEAAPDRGNVKAQINSFEPGMLCYIMTEQSLSMGLDPDGDRLNDPMERQLGTNAHSPDTDADGIWDGVEYLFHTDPVRRDTDGDGVIDGIEDEDWDGRIDPLETNPRERDSDGDGLCDGFCRIRLRRGLEVFAGEDRNLNGQVDAGELDPLSIDTDKDKILDFQELLNCYSSGNKDKC